MVNLKTLRHYKIHSTVPPYGGTVQWSIDNQVAVVNRKGVVIFELTGDPRRDSSSKLCTNRTFVSVQKEIPSVDTSFPEDDIFTQHNKPDLYDLMLDRISTPRGYSGIDFNNHFTQVRWSPRTIDSAYPYLKPKCLLAGLSSNFQLKIYDSKARGQMKADASLEASVTNKDLNYGAYNPNANGEDEEGGGDGASYSDAWTPILDMTKIYNDILVTEWDKTIAFSKSIYKQRMYELAFCDFTWMDMNENFKDIATDEVDYVPGLITFQCNGDIVIWKIFVCKEEQTFFAKIALKKNVNDTNIVSTSKFVQISTTVGLLAVGFKTGGIRVFLVEDGSSHGEFSMKGEIDVYDNDELKIEFLEFVVDSSAKTSDEKQKIIILAIKHPDIIMSFGLTVSSSVMNSSVQCDNEIHHCRSPNGLVVGLSKLNVDTFMLNHETGDLGCVQVVDGRISYHSIESYNAKVSPENENDDDDDDDIKEEKELWLHRGFSLSPNSTMACFNKVLSKTHDTILIKDPSECTFASVLLNGDIWTEVKRKYKENNYNLQKIHDVLHVLRYQMRQSIQDPEHFLDGKDLTQLTLEEVKLFLWIIKAIGLPKSWKFVQKNFVSHEVLNKLKLNLMKLIALSEELVVEKYLTKEIERAYHNGTLPVSKKPKDLQSACIIIQYLISKPDPRISESIVAHLADLVNYDSARPRCPECGEKMSFLNNTNYLPEENITKPGIPGYRWKGQTCPEQHDVPVCILSLIPLEYPNRSCPFCGCASLMEPAFNQKPVCPFCEEFLEFEPVLNLDDFQHQELPPPLPQEAPIDAQALLTA